VNRAALGMVLVAAGAALFGTLGYVSRNAAAVGVGPLGFVAWRAGIGTVTLLAASAIVALRSSPPRRWLPDPRVLEQHRRRALLAAALAGAVLNVAIFSAFQMTTIAVALICFYTYPAMVTLAAVPLYGERLDRVRSAALALSSAGLAVVVLAPLIGSAGVVVDPIGVVLALFAAVCEASFILIAGRGFDPLPSLHVSALVVLAAAVVAAPLALLAGDAGALVLPFQDPGPWPWILAGGIAGAAIPTTAFIAGIGLVGPSRAAILMTIEPLVGVLLAGLLLGERPAALQLAGGTAVLLAAAVLQVAPRVPAEPEAELAPLV
jgi:drug/metabolite transporter (DMT)-like permease